MWKKAELQCLLHVIHLTYVTKSKQNLRALEKLNFTYPSWFSFHIFICFGGATKKVDPKVKTPINLLGDVYANICLNLILSLEARKLKENILNPNPKQNDTHPLTYTVINRDKNQGNVAITKKKTLNYKHVLVSQTWKLEKTFKCEL